MFESLKRFLKKRYYLPIASTSYIAWTVAAILTQNSAVYSADLVATWIFCFCISLAVAAEIAERRMRAWKQRRINEWMKKRGE